MDEAMRNHTHKVVRVSEYTVVSGYGCHVLIIGARPFSSTPGKKTSYGLFRKCGILDNSNFCLNSQIMWFYSLLLKIFSKLFAVCPFSCFSCQV